MVRVVLEIGFGFVRGDAGVLVGDVVMRLDIRTDLKMFGMLFIEGNRGVDDVRRSANLMLAVSILPRRAGRFRLELRRPW